MVKFPGQNSNSENLEYERVDMFMLTSNDATSCHISHFNLHLQGACFLINSLKNICVYYILHYYSLISETSANLHAPSKKALSVTTHISKINTL